MDRTVPDDLADGQPGLLCHEAEGGEDDEARHEGRECVCERDDDAVAVEVVVEFVVARHRDERAPRSPYAEEQLLRRLGPRLHSTAGEQQNWIQSFEIKWEE